MERMIYFKDTHILNNMALCRNVLRIPEIFLIFRQTIDILDQKKAPHYSKLKEKLYLLINMDEALFKKAVSVDIHFWYTVMTLIQVGLYKRYLKTQARPLAFITPSHITYASQICGKTLTIGDLLEKLFDENEDEDKDEDKNKKSSSKTKKTSQSQIVSSHNNTLSFFKHNKDSNQYDCLASSLSIKEDLLKYLEKYTISQIIVIGPNCFADTALQFNGNSQFKKANRKDNLLHEIKTSAVLNDKISIIESIDLDPLLFWFWKDMQNSRQLSGY